MSENLEKYARIAEATDLLQTMPEYPGGFFGRGCIILGGGRYAVSAFVTASELREQGWLDPVEVWHLGREEMNDGLRQAFRTLDVTCVDAREYLAKSPMKCFGGWESKVFAVLESRFREVLCLDADSTPVRNPGALFESRGYADTGALFWPDLERYRHDAGQPRWEVFGVSYRDVPEWETGQFLVDKQRCWRALQLTWHYNANSDYYYRFVHGDKDCFHLAWLRCGASFSLMPPAEPREWGLRQFDPDGNLLFQHRTLAKFRFEQTASCPDFENEARCLEHIRNLRRQWEGFPPLRLTGDAAMEAGVRRFQGNYIYAPMDGIPATLVLLEDGAVVSLSGAVPWTAWRPLAEEGGFSGVSLHAADGWHGPARWNGVCLAGHWPMPWLGSFVMMRSEVKTGWL